MDQIDGLKPYIETAALVAAQPVQARSSGFSSGGGGGGSSGSGDGGGGGGW